VPDDPRTFDAQRLVAAVPACLRQRAQWVAWTYVLRDGQKTKCPVSPTRGGKASSINPATWGTFEQALAACQNGTDLVGVGFVFTPDDPYAGVDLDDCIDSGGQIKPWALAFLTQLDSYSELSPSGTGVKVFVQARKAGSKCRKPYADGQVEMYDRGRFFTVTGARLPEYAADVLPRQAAFDAVYAAVIGAEPAPAAVGPVCAPPPPPSMPTVVIDDDEIQRLAGKSRKSGAKFQALWAGRWNDHFNSRSEADSSVAFTLAFYTKDAAQIDRLFRRSGLMRDKWDEQHGEQTYGQMTIAKALATVTGQYQPRRSSKNGAAPASRSPPTTSASSGRPQIQGNERQLRDIRSDALSALHAANRPPRLFQRAGGIARIAFVQQEHATILPRVQQLDPDALRGELTNVADWFTLKHGKQGDYVTSDLPPLSIARDILSQPKLDLPPLYGVVTCPTFAADGSLVVADGYHATSGLWHHRTLTDLAPVPEAPDEAAVAAARSALLDILADFPFIDAASRANAVALLLLPFVRPLIAGPTPLHAVDAPSPATGKDLLVKSALLPALGQEVGATTAAKDPDEWRKKITSALLADSPAILWGNVVQRLDSEHLAAVLTDTIWRDRQLGHTRELLLPNRAVWTTTGNNLAFSRELARRVVWIRLDARMETPESRSGFRHPNLPAYVRGQRTELVHAALTLVRAWLAAGRPAGGQTMGSFENYVAVMGGILGVAGVPGFLANADELRRRSDVETADWRAFVLAWWQRWGEARVGVSDLATLLWEDGGKRTDLLTTQVSAPTERGALTQLGMRVSRKRDCVIAGYRITAADPDKSGRQQYCLIRTDGIPFPETAYLSHTLTSEVCQPKSNADEELQQSADLGIPFPDPPHMCTGACARHAHAHSDCTGVPGKRYAEVCQTAQPQTDTQDKPADLPAYLGHTLPVEPKRYADNVAGQNGVAWYAGNGDSQPKAVLELARRRDGWTPKDWYNRLLQLAGRCADLNPERAAELRSAAALMTSGEGRHAP
jgi:hypothetical protein